MDLLAPLHRLDDVQIRHRNSAILFATIKKFSNDSAGNLAAMLTFYGFFSIFPLLLVFVTVLGYVLAGLFLAIWVASVALWKLARVE